MIFHKISNLLKRGIISFSHKLNINKIKSNDLLLYLNSQKKLLPINFNADMSKPGILLIDDNAGICSFLDDDFKDILNKKYKDYNVFIFTGTDAAYKFISTNELYNLNIKYAIIDIMLNGIIETETQNIRLTGIDVLEYLMNTDGEFKFILYTGNQLNPNIRYIKEIITQFNNITGFDIQDHIMFKTIMSNEERQDIIKQRFGL